MMSLILFFYYFADGVNNLVDVKFDVTGKIITCNFKNQPATTMKQCDANITYGENCDKQLNTYKGMGVGNAVSTSQLETIPGVTDYCFVVTAVSNNISVIVEGDIVNSGT